MMTRLSTSSTPPLVKLTFAFIILAFIFSLVGFLHPEPAVQNHEYSLPLLAVEVVGHFSFGFVASLPLVDLGLSLAVGSMAVLIDVDHLLAALGFSVDSRPDHSMAYAAMTSVVLFVLAGRAHLPNARAKKAAFVGFVVVLSHIAYDVFSAEYLQQTAESDFPLFIPASFQTMGFADSSWILFEGLAIAVSVIAYFAVRVSRRQMWSK